MEMIKVPKGFIMMRDNRTKKKWTQKIEPFLLAKYPVTIGQYYGDTSQLPVTDISWFDAIIFCNKISINQGLEPYYDFNPDSFEVIESKTSKGYRLPSEAEWEYGCRAGSQTYRYGKINDIAWYNDNCTKLPLIGTKKANDWGLYDTLGCVWEWCNDIYDIEAYGLYRTFRGGSYADEARACGATVRRRSHPTAQLEDLGFRVCRSL